MTSTSGGSLPDQGCKMGEDELNVKKRKSYPLMGTNFLRRFFHSWPFVEKNFYNPLALICAVMVSAISSAALPKATSIFGGVPVRTDSTKAASSRFSGSDFCTAMSWRLRPAGVKWI